MSHIRSISLGIIIAFIYLLVANPVAHTLKHPVLIAIISVLLASISLCILVGSLLHIWESNIYSKLYITFVLLVVLAIVPTMMFTSNHFLKNQHKELQEHGVTKSAVIVKKEVSKGWRLKNVYKIILAYEDTSQLVIEKSKLVSKMEFLSVNVGDRFPITYSTRDSDILKLEIAVNKTKATMKELGISDSLYDALQKKYLNEEK